MRLAIIQLDKEDAPMNAAMKAAQQQRRRKRSQNPIARSPTTTKRMMKTFTKSRNTERPVRGRYRKTATYQFAANTGPAQRNRKAAERGE